MYKAAVLTISDRCFNNTYEDLSGPKVIDILKNSNYDLSYYDIIPDEKEIIKDKLKYLADELNISLIITTGGTGFAPRDVTPEATIEIIDKRCDGIAELMRLESLKFTPKACLSRSVAGIRNKSLIINLPGSPKAAKENLEAVIKQIDHGLDMLYTINPKDCASDNKTNKPSIDSWLNEAKKSNDSDKIGIFLTHNGIVRKTAKKQVREGIKEADVSAMIFSYDEDLVNKYISEVKNFDGIYYLEIWLNNGYLQVGDDIMQILIGADIRPNAIKALDYLISKIKCECVKEEEIYKTK